MGKWRVVKTYPIEMPYHDVLNYGMFLRKICVQKDGKAHNYWALVESYRTERGPRQRVVSYLGEMDEAGRLGVEYAAEGHPAIQDSLFEDTTAEWVAVDVRRVRTERSRRFGEVWLALELMKKLGLTELFERLMPSTRPKVLWSEIANVLVVARFCEPSSELHIAEHFYRTSALSDLLGIPEEDIYENRLYRVLDELVVHKDDVERYLKERLGELFEIKYDILLYDVASTYNEPPRFSR